MVIFHVKDGKLEGDSAEAKNAQGRVTALRATSQHIAEVMGKSGVSYGYVSREDTIAYRENGDESWVGFVDENASPLQSVVKRLSLADNSKEDAHAS